MSIIMFLFQSFVPEEYLLWAYTRGYLHIEMVMENFSLQWNILVVLKWLWSFQLFNFETWASNFNPWNFIKWLYAWYNGLRTIIENILINCNSEKKASTFHPPLRDLVHILWFMHFVLARVRTDLLYKTVSNWLIPWYVTLLSQLQYGFDNCITRDYFSYTIYDWFNKL